MLSVQSAGHPAGFLLPLTFNPPHRKMNLTDGQTPDSSKDEHWEHLHQLRRPFITHAAITTPKCLSNAPFHAGKTDLCFL